MTGRANVQRLLVLGSGYSGTTLLAMGLSTSPEVVAIGELPMFRSARPREDPCTCGSPFADCPLWSAVFGDASPATSGENLGASVALEVAIDRLRDRVAAIAPRARLLVDSGKTVQGGLEAHLRLGTADLRAIHLVRHPAAVVHSSLYRSVSLEQAIRRWIDAQRTTIAALEAAAIPARRLKYEELVADFGATLGALGAWLGVAGPLGERDGASWRWEQAAWTERSHIMASNPRRFQGRPEGIAEEAGWRFALGPAVVAEILARAGELAELFGYTA